MTTITYASVHFSIMKDSSWKDASRFYAAAKRRGWWVSKDRYEVFITHAAEAEIVGLLEHLGIPADTYEVSL